MKVKMSRLSGKMVLRNFQHRKDRQVCFSFLSVKDVKLNMY